MMRTEESPLPRLMEEIAQLNSKLHELSIKNYRQVVDARESLSRCASSSVGLEQRLEHATSQSIPELRSNLLSFQESGRKLLQQHKQTLATIEFHTQLVDLLQIPQLMDTCARSGAVEEALELCSFARTLKMRHEAIASSLGPSSKGVEIVLWVAEEVEQSALAMRRQLLLQLRGPVDLPTCLRLLSFLKRLDAQQRRRDGVKKDESQLRREFLEARDAYLQMQTISASDRGDPSYQATLKTIQKNREMWFDVITQYQAIFGTNRDDGSAETLARWIGTKIQEFLRKLEENLTRFENCGELGTVYELSSSFAASLSRVGADFRPLLPPLFVKRARQLVNAQWSATCSSAREGIRSGEWGEALPLPPSSMSSSSATTSGGEVTDSTSKEKEKADSTVPPPQVLQFPVLVELLNGLLRSFNDLRNFAIVNMARDLAGDLKAHLENVMLGLDEFDRSDLPAATQRRFEALCETLAVHVLPHVTKCFAVVFEWKSSPNSLLDLSACLEKARRFVPVPTVVATKPPVEHESHVPPSKPLSSEDPVPEE